MVKVFKLVPITLLFLLMAACSSESKKTETESTALVSNIKHSKWTRDASIYEVNIRQHSAEGTFKGLEDDIPRLKDLGIKILWLMPIHPIGEQNRKGSLGSYYSVKDYLAINPDYGTEEDFRNLIKKAHEAGMKVILDWVANHTAWDHVWTTSHPAYYNLTEEGGFMPPVADWSDVIDLNYDNPDMREAMKAAMKYWVSEFDIDGYRCDVAEMVPTDFWVEVRRELDDIKPVFMLAEGEDPELHMDAFDMTYSWELMHLMRKIAANEEELSAIRALYERDFARFPKDYYKMNIITNHDENSWNGTAEEFFGPAQEAWTVFAATTYGMPLVYSGQEVNNTKRLAFFEKDPIDWTQRSSLTYLIKTLINLKKKSPALWNGQGDLNWIETGKDDQVLAYTRSYNDDEVLVLINISDQLVEFELDREYPSMLRVFGGGILTATQEQKLAPYAYKVFYK